MIQIFNVFTKIAIFKHKKAVFQCVMIRPKPPKAPEWYTELVEMLPKGLVIPAYSLVIPASALVIPASERGSPYNA